MSPVSRNRRRQRGFGLVEMMIAMVLGLLLVAAAIQVFLSTRASYRYNQALAEVQDGARFAMHVLTHDLRLAGYTGCPAPQSDAPSVASRSPFGDVRVISNSAAATGVTAANLLADSLTAPDDELPASADGDSDAIRLAYMRDYGVRVTGPAASLNANLKVTGNPAGWEAGDTLLVTDCRQADLFDATSVSKSTGGPWINIAHANSANSSNKLSKIYDEGARVLQPYAVVYYVDGDDGGLLRRRYFAETAKRPPTDEMVSDLTHLTVRYGVDADGDQMPDAYETEDTVDTGAAWDDVVSVRIGFVVGSETRVGDAGGQGGLTMFGDEITVPDDGRLRQVFTTTVALRNRVP
ncbi:type IV pilus assembly protein PilW [Salinisphaera sp. PC39]|uniref:PilW family protein n=1 Tax=Salinisphaera sp. PC39 TaxID=1304156 RepID=UPI00333E7DC0